MSEEGKTLAQVIHDQLRWGDHWRPARWAARDYYALPEKDHGAEIGKVQGGLMFSVSGTINVKRGGRVMIYLTWSDTYTVKIVQINGTNIKTVLLRTDVYCDELGEVIDRALDGERVAA
jgi:hypothetical protein